MKIFLLSAIIFQFTNLAIAQNFMNIKDDSDAIKVSTDAILMSLYSIRVDEITTDSFSERSNIPKDHIIVCKPYMVKEKFIEDNENLILTDLGATKAEKLANRGTNITGARASNESTIDLKSNKSQGVIISGTEANNNSKVEIKVSENIENVSKNKNFKDFILFKLWRKWWGRLLLIIAGFLFAAFAVWSSLTDSIKDNLTKPDNVKQDVTAPIIIEGTKADNHSSIEIEVTKGSSSKK